jgi:hypothetical protein
LLTGVALTPHIHHPPPPPPPPPPRLVCNFTRLLAFFYLIVML